MEGSHVPKADFVFSSFLPQIQYVPSHCNSKDLCGTVLKAIEPFGTLGNLELQNHLHRCIALRLSFRLCWRHKTEIGRRDGYSTKRRARPPTNAVKPTRDAGICDPCPSCQGRIVANQK